MVLEGRPLLGPEMLPEPPDPWWTRRSTIPPTTSPATSPPASVPQCIAHRGYKAAYPENTMAAFRAAAAVGAHAIETDLHLTRDGVVVLSHDASLKRCFGVDKKLMDCDWEYVSTLRTLKEPHEPMPRLAELLDFLTEDGVNHMWLLLDIKIDDDAEELLMRTAATIAASHTRNARPWRERIIFGCWTTAYLSAARELVPTFPLAHIGFSTKYARKFLPIPNVSFNLLQKVLVGPVGASFLRDARRADRRVFAWTVNDEAWMRWCVDHAIDGVITDEPELFLDVCARQIEQRKSGLRVKRRREKEGKFVKRMVDLAFVQVLMTLLTMWCLVTGMYNRPVRRRESQKVVS